MNVRGHEGAPCHQARPALLEMLIGTALLVRRTWGGISAGLAHKPAQAPRQAVDSHRAPRAESALSPLEAAQREKRDFQRTLMHQHEHKGPGTNTWPTIVLISSVRRDSAEWARGL